ncbi:MAG: hypothetical protein H6627_04750 [Calditrichae bacterium]|nr:hypothetical protein [Calditrichota bacterium]MCB9057851.1 hypothetical protein [Calditrichia bacterium]
MTFLEIIGYCGSALIALSLMMKSMVRLRWINLLGASTFATYGFLIGAYPVLALNSFITMIDVIYLFQIYYKKDFFEIFPVQTLHTSFLKRFIEFHDKDIRYFFPDINYDNIENPFVFFILRNMLPVGLFIGESKGLGILEIKLDYVIPNYRDLKTASYLYKKRRDHFLHNAFRELEIFTSVAEHIKFVKRIGFNQDIERKDRFFLLLDK